MGNGWRIVHRRQVQRKDLIASLIGSIGYVKSEWRRTGGQGFHFRTGMPVFHEIGIKLGLGETAPGGNKAAVNINRALRRIRGCLQRISEDIGRVQAAGVQLARGNNLRRAFGDTQRQIGVYLRKLRGGTSFPSGSA